MATRTLSSTTNSGITCPKKRSTERQLKLKGGIRCVCPSLSPSFNDDDDDDDRSIDSVSLMDDASDIDDEQSIASVDDSFHYGESSANSSTHSSTSTNSITAHSKRKSVKFRDEIQTFDIRNSDEDGDKERLTSTWISSRDYQKAYRAARKTLAHQKRTNTIIHGCASSSHIQDELIQWSGVAAKQRRQQSISAVLTVQKELQREGRLYDPELIALTYSRCTTHSVECAYLRGLKEQEECHHPTTSPSTACPTTTTTRIQVRV